MNFTAFLGSGNVMEAEKRLKKVENCDGLYADQCISIHQQYWKT